MAWSFQPSSQRPLNAPDFVVHWQMDQDESICSGKAHRQGKVQQFLLVGASRKSTNQLLLYSSELTNLSLSSWNQGLDLKEEEGVGV